MIEVFADVICPFTHVGLRRLAARRDAEGHDDVRLHVRSWPLELVNGHPVDPEMIAHEIEVIRDDAAPDLFSGFDAGTFPATSIPAMALTAAAYRQGDATGEAVALELRELLFEQGLDVADPEVLATVAARHGLASAATGERAAVEADYAEGQRRGVKGSPHFFVGGTDAFCPSLDISKPEGELRVAFDREAFEAFVDRAFASG